MTLVPRRVLIVSADIGEGHNSAGHALEEAAARVWPGCEVLWLDALTAVGPRFAALARAFYVAQVQRMPWMYEFFYTAMSRHHWYLQATRQGLGAVFGHKLAPALRSSNPDVIISTYPLGSAGLSWLRRRGQASQPVAAWVPAFCPHPSWLYGNLDITYVMHEAAAAVATAAEPRARIAVGAPPVRDAFSPVSQAASRAKLGIGADRFVVAVCTGSLAFGRVDSAVTAVLAAGPLVHAIVVCGRNHELRDRLARRNEDPARLRVLGWTDDMAAWMGASDVVVANGGGATALEAAATGRPVIMFEPIAGHGRANASLMTSTGLALSAPSAAELTAIIRQFAADPDACASQAGFVLAWARKRRREDDLADLSAIMRP